MKKKLHIVLIVLLVIAGAAVVFVAQRDSDGVAAKTDVAAARTAKEGPLPKCLAANAQLTVDADDRASIDMAAATQLVDVPAGTNTVVNITTYDGTMATGSELYPKDYGTFNFTAKKNTSAHANQMTWEMTSFTPCEG